MSSKTLLRTLAPIFFLAAFLVCCAAATASPGAYRVLVVYNDDDPPLQLQQQISSEPGVAAVDLVETELDGIPSPSKLGGYDLVVDTPDNTYSDKVAYGNALADFLDAGGVLVQFAYDNWESNPGEGAGPEGRFASGGYAPFLIGDNPNDPLSLGTFDAASPLMQGVGPLTSNDNTDPQLAPGATLVAQWDNGVNAIAYKGNVVSSSAYLGGSPFNGSGNYGRLIVNAVRWLGRQTLTVTNLNPAGGTVIGSEINCGPTCSAALKHDSSVGLGAVANPGFAFGGFGGACAGSICSVTMDAPKAVTASFVSFGTAKKVKLNKRKGTAVLSFGVGAPGQVVLSGRKAKKQSRTVGAAGRVKLPIVAKGKALTRLHAAGRAKIKVRVAFTPAGGTIASFTKKVTLKLLPVD